MNDSHTLRGHVRALRRAGSSRRQIKEELGISTNWELDRLLDGQPPPEWTKRPNAKDDLRERARQLRGEGWTYDEFVAELCVTKSSVSLWVRDVSTPALEQRKEELKKAHATRMSDARWDPIRRQRNIERQETKLAAAQQIGDLSDRDLLMLGAIAYWCEGAKDKTTPRTERVKFINSDPALIGLFLRFLEVAGVASERVGFRVHIHETADAADATRYWSEVTGAGLERFYRPLLKRHRPQTNRKNVGDGYRGCLEVQVLQSTELYRKIEGWAYGAMLGCDRPEQPKPSLTPSIGGQLPRRLRQWRRARR